MRFVDTQQADSAIRGRVLIALRKANRPVTASELRFHFLGNTTTSSLQPVLDEFVGVGTVVRATEWDQRYHREYVLYRLAEEGDVI
jgi:hypothetical protein